MWTASTTAEDLHFGSTAAYCNINPLKSNLNAAHCHFFTFSLSMKVPKDSWLFQVHECGSPWRSIASVRCNAFQMFNSSPGLVLYQSISSSKVLQEKKNVLKLFAGVTGEGDVRCVCYFFPFAWVKICCRREAAISSELYDKSYALGLVGFPVLGL